MPSLSNLAGNQVVLMGLKSNRRLKGKTDGGNSVTVPPLLLE